MDTKNTNSKQLLRLWFTRVFIYNYVIVGCKITPWTNSTWIPFWNFYRSSSTTTCYFVQVLPGECFNFLTVTNQEQYEHLQFLECKPTIESICSKVDTHKSNIAIIRIPIVEWYVVRCKSKIWHQKDMCSKEIGLCAQNMLTIVAPVMNMICGGGAYMTS